MVDWKVIWHVCARIENASERSAVMRWRTWQQQPISHSPTTNFNSFFSFQSNEIRKEGQFKKLLIGRNNGRCSFFAFKISFSRVLCMFLSA